MTKTHRLAFQCCFLGFFLAGYLGGSNLFASQQFDELKAIDQTHLEEVDKFKSAAKSDRQKSAGHELQDDYTWIGVCNPAPISSTTQGPTISHNYSRFNDTFKMVAWRYPCDENSSYVIITIKPISGPVFFCSSQLTLAQGGIQNDDFKLTQDPVNNDSSHCGDVYIDTSFALKYWSFATRNIDLESSFDLYWDFGDNTQKFTMFAYNPSDYGIGGEPPPKELSNDVGVNGLFYDPSNSGHGFDIVRHETGLVIYYYGHTASGQRLWLVSENYMGDLDYNEEFRVDLYEVVEGTFGHPNLPSTKWGSLLMEFSDCDSGKASLNGSDGILSFDFVRLAGLPNIDCE